MIVQLIISCTISTGTNTTTGKLVAGKDCNQKQGLPNKVVDHKIAIYPTLQNNIIYLEALK